jgi:hypothetical protein
VLLEARRHIERDAGVDPAAGAFDHVDEPGLCGFGFLFAWFGFGGHGGIM